MTDASTDNSDLKIDIKDLYNQLITPIDNMRSLVNISDQKNKTLIETAIKKVDLGDLLSNLTVVSNPIDYQESRFSAFCRMVGFPVIGADGYLSNLIFNPGMNLDSTELDDIVKTNLQITASQLNIANVFFNKREDFYLTRVKEIVSNSARPIDMNVFLLQIGTTIGSLTINTYYGNITKAGINNGIWSFPNYQYELDGMKDFRLNEFTDVNNNYTIPITNFDHYNYPLITDGRIALTVMPSSRVTTTPFCENNKYNNDLLKRPLLEKIIKDRFSMYLATEAGIGASFINTTNNEQAKKSVEAIQNDSVLRSDNPLIVTLYNNLNGTQKPPYNDDEIIKNQKFLATLNQLAVSLVDNIKTIHEKLQDYYWMPKCNPKGPEFGVTSTDVFKTLKDVLPKNDVDILLLGKQDTITRLLSNFSTNNTKKQSEYSFNQFYNVFSPDQVSGFISTVKKNLDEAIAKRKEALSQAEEALKNVEILTGQVSGLGLIEVFIFIAALHLMDKNNLLGFLDNDSYNKAKISMKVILDNTDITGVDGLKNKPSVLTAYFDLEQQIKTLYNYFYIAYDQKMLINKQ